MSKRTVGPFTLDMATGDLVGPADYMASENYRRKMAAIEAGTDMLSTSPFASRDLGTAILVSIQTDYAAWRGQQELLRAVAR